MRRLRACGFAAALFFAASPSWAQDALKQAHEALQKQDVPAAIRILQDAAGKGDTRAQGMLSDVLLNAAPPDQDAPRACKLAQVVSEVGDSMGEAVHAQCLLLGVIKDPQALVHARELARASMQLGDPAGAYMVYVAFILDPANTYIRDGKTDMAAYEALASRPLSARADQVEAFDALGFAALRGNPKAALSLATYLFETVAPGNVARLRDVIGALRKDGNTSPALLQFQQRAGQIVAAGNTKASVKAFADAYRTTLFLVQNTDAVTSGGKRCEEIRVAAIDSGDVQDAEFLPLTSGALKDSYLVRGSWDEVWQFSGCERITRAKIHFTADGWGGARFRSEILP